MIKIYTYEIEDELFFRYKRIIDKLKQDYSCTYEIARADVHQQILESVGLRRGIDEIECDKFNECLYKLLNF